MENKEFKFEGIKELTEALQDLPVELQAKILKGFLTKVGRKFIVNELKTVLNYSEKTESTIKVVGIEGNKLGISAGVTSKGYPLRFADLGTKIRKGKKGQNKGQIIGKHQIQPTIEKQIDPIMNYTQEELGNEINKNLQRRLKKFKNK